MQASDWLSKQLVDLQMKVETSQEKLVRFQKEHEILGADEKQNIITEKLGELNKLPPIARRATSICTRDALQSRPILSRNVL